MQAQQKLGLGFILFGIVLITAVYFATSGGAFVFSALLGLMAIVFGAFQLMLAQLAPSKNNHPEHSKTKGKAKKTRR